MLKVKSKREPYTSKRHKTVGKKSKKRLQQRVEITSAKSKGNLVSIEEGNNFRSFYILCEFFFFFSQSQKTLQTTTDI